MSTKTYFLAVIVGGLCLAVTGINLPLRAQADRAIKTPISFYGLGNDQAIRFFVGVKHTRFSAAGALFEVEVSDQPRPEAKIRMWINAAMKVPEAEKEWGHPVNAWVSRPLTPANLQTLENFLALHRAKGEVPPPAQSGKPAMGFTRITYRTNKQGNRYADTGQKEFYPASEEAERDFVTKFIGFSDSSGN